MRNNNLISEETIRTVKETAKIEDVVGEFVALRNSGSSLVGLCPFHEEKTPSFHVTPAKGLFKCFGCDKGGDSIQFLIDYQKIGFPEAVKYLATKYSIPVEGQEITNEELAKRKTFDSEEKVTHLAMTAYKQLLLSDTNLIESVMQERSVSLDTVVDFDLGFAPGNWSFLTQKLITENLLSTALEIGILKRSDQKNNVHDFFRNRFMIPISNTKGVTVGFTGRKLEDNNEDNPKYLNSQSVPDFFEIRNLLFGYWQAKNEIAKRGEAILVEGAWDCLSFFDKGLKNTVATLGTTFTDSQAKILKAKCKNILIARDGDAAGIGSALKAINTCLSNDIYPRFLQMPKGVDPDQLSRTGNLQSYIEENTIDGLIWSCQYRSALAKGIQERTKMKEEIIEMLGLIADENLRNESIEQINKKLHLGIKKTSAARKSKSTALLSKGEDSDKSSRVKYKEDGSIWIRGGRNWEEVASNFHLFIEYLTINDDEERTWILKLIPTNGDPIFMEVSHEDFCSASKLRKVIAAKEFSLRINDTHLQELHSYLFDRGDYRKALKIKRYGFNEISKTYVFSNAVFSDGQLLFPDSLGIVVSGKNAISLPKLKKDVKHPFTYTGYTISFDKWFEIYRDAHTPDYTFVPACWYIMSLFRDITISNKGFCPLLYLKGPHGTGKSSIIRHQTCLSGYQSRNINLKAKNSEPGVTRTLSQYSNFLTWVDEFGNRHPMEGILQATYDNNGQLKADEGLDLGTSDVDVKSTVGITSNVLPEDNIFFSRCIYLQITSQQKTEQQKACFDQLKQTEQNGLACVTIEIISHREMIEKEYTVNYDLLHSALKKHPDLAAETLSERIISNMAVTLTPAFILASAGVIHITKAVDKANILAEFIENAKRLILVQHNILKGKSPLHEFCDILQVLFDEGKITQGIHFKFESGEHEGNIALRFGNLYTLFLQRYRSVYFREPPDRETLKDEIFRLTGKNLEKEVFVQIRFRSESLQNPDKNKDVPCKDSVRISYRLLMEKFSLDLTSGKYKSSQ